MTRNRIVELLGFGLVFVGCHSNETGSSELNEPVPEPPRVADPQPAPRVNVLPQEELRGVYRRASLAIRETAGAFRGGYQTHEVQINKGVIEVTPQRASGERGAPVRFETRSIGRDDSPINSRIVTEQVTPLGELRVDRGAVIEEIENREEGIEQRWKFAAAPAGSGDLVIDVNVKGHTRVESTGSGLHFLAFAGPGFRYSHARWLDSAGHVWAVPAVWESDRIRLRVPGEMLAETTFPATLDPTIEAEEAVDDVVVGNSIANALAPTIASRGPGFLVVWADQRIDSKGDIFGARMSAGGGILDFSGLKINTAALDQTQPVVARVDPNWVVAWKNGTDIAAATVDDNGAVTQLGAVVATAASEKLPAIGSNGTGAVVAWQSDNDIRAAFFNGAAFGAAFDIATTTAVEVDPAVAANPSGGFLVVWNDDVGAKGQLLTAAGALSGGVISIAASGSQVAATFDGTDYIVTYTFGSDVNAVRVSTAGTVLDAVPVVVGTGNGLQSESAVSCDSSSCLVMWSDSRALNTTNFDLFGQRVSFSLALIGGEFPVQTAVGPQVAPSIAVGSAGWITTYEDGRTGGATVATAARINSAGVVQDPAGFLINTGFNAEVEAATAAAGAGTQLVVWSDSRVLGNDIMGVRYSSVGGARLDTPAKTISNAANDQATPSVSFDGTQFMAVWGDARGADRDIFAARFGTNGTLTDQAGIAVTTAAGLQGAPDVASGNGVSLVVWADRRNGAFDIFGAIINSSGVVTVSDIVISNAQGDQNAPAVVFDPNNNVFVVVWSDQRVLDTGDIFGTRVSTAGAVLDPSGVQIAGSQFAQVQPDIAVSGTVVMVVWDDRRSDPTGDIVGSRINTTGGLNVLDPGGIPISAIPPGRQNSPAIIGTPGNTFLVAWTDTRNQGSTGSDIFGVQLNSSGIPADTTGFAIAASTGDETGVSFQSDANADGRVALVYNYFRSDVGASRVFRRLVTVDAAAQAGNNGSLCLDDSACTSGFCVDNRCCNSACGGSNNFTDCQTCSVVRGGAVDGVCGPVITESICRGHADNFCDEREYCDGVSLQCPADVGRDTGKACTTQGGQPGTCPLASGPGPHVCQ